MITSLFESWLARFRGADKTFGVERSPAWRAAAREHLIANPLCVGCGEADLRLLQVHHLYPVHLYPELEMNIRFWRTLCVGPWRCHLELGHGGDFRAFNASMDKDAQRRRDMIRNRHYEKVMVW